VTAPTQDPPRQAVLVNFGGRVPADLRQQAKVRAAQTGMDVQDVLRDALTQHLAIPIELRARAESYAADNGTTFVDVLRDALAEHLDLHASKEQ
jgi:plasmid stability protein